MNSRRRPLLALFAVGLVVLAIMPATAATRWDGFSRSSLLGSGRASMQLEAVPARVARVAVRPGTAGKEAWALGTSTARSAGWERGPAGQVVFLKRTPATGWVLVGPPLDAAGRVFNPLLSSLAIAGSGEGWAVGDHGVILHKPAGSDRWSRHRDSGLVPNPLTSVSLAPDGSGVAVGVGPSILLLSGGRWRTDAVPPDMSTQTRELHAVAAVSASDAWAIATGQISGVDSTSLLIYRRGTAGWTRVTTGEPIFDAPPARAEGGFVNRAAEAGAIAADATGAWIGGRMHPRPASQPEGDSTPGDASRAFVLRVPNAGSGTPDVTSYCPDNYTDRTPDGRVNLTQMCDQPFPTTPHHIASLSIAPGGDVFAGGLGLFRFSRGGWYREPDTNGYLISIAFGSNNEGFAASSGDSLGAGGLIRSSTTTIGHWTASPVSPATARWPQPQGELLESIAMAPDGRAVAVGTKGAAIAKSGGLGWDSVTTPIEVALHAVAWPNGLYPIAVGADGFIFTRRGNEFDYFQGPSSQSMFGLAFRNARDGVAAGLGGGLIYYEDGRWRADSSVPTRTDFYAVAATADGYVVVGRNATIMEGRPGAWRLRSEGRALLRRPDEDNAPTLYAATVAKDGTVWMGGQDSSLLIRTPSGQIRQAPAAVEGMVIALAAKGDAILASVSPDQDKYRGEVPSAQRGTLMRLTGNRWTDVGASRRSTLLRDEVDPSQFEDPIYSIAMSDESNGWAVGGSPAELKNQTEGHFRSNPTGAVYRVAVGGNPEPPTERAPVINHGGIPFAAFGETWCGNGLCSSALGTGNQADLVALKIRDEINEASRQPGGPRFVVFAGSMRRNGIPEELAQFRAYIRGFRIPVFAIPGSTDRFAGVDIAGVAGVGSTGGSTDHWQQAFAQMPAPWGHDPAPPNIQPVEDVTPALSGARTHYAFNYMVGGRPALRMIFVDSSTRSWGTIQDQNPQEDQSVWLKNTLNNATSAGLPAIVVMNQPSITPAETQIGNWIAGQDQDFDASVLSGRASAVITAGFRQNLKDAIKVLIPLYIVGGGGAPLGREASANVEAATKLPTDGYYHGWHLFNVDVNNRTALGQARITNEVYPVLESLAMHSDKGIEIPVGQAANITALARGLNGGFSDQDQAKTVYMSYGRSILRCGGRDQGEGFCISDLTIMPAFRFRSLSPDVADFVRRNPLNAYEPYRDRLPGGKLGPVEREPSGVSGLLCTFNAGTAPIEITAGTLRSVVEITVGPGSGPCRDGVIPPTPTPTPTPVPEPTVAPEEEPFLYVAPRLRVEAVAIFPPPPAPAVAPAPPGAPGVGRKEEHEIQTETEGHGEYDFTAKEVTRLERRYAFTPLREVGTPVEEHSTWFLGVFALSAFALASGAAAVRARRMQLQTERISS